MIEFEEFGQVWVPVEDETVGAEVDGAFLEIATGVLEDFGELRVE
jgi:hypothetical protein